MADAPQNNIILSTGTQIPRHERGGPPRLEPRARIEVKFRRGVQQTVVAGHHFRAREADKDGWVRKNAQGAPILVYEADLEHVKQKIENDFELLERAEVSHRRKHKLFLQKITGIEVDKIPDDEEDFWDELRQASLQFTGSIEAEFHSIAGRGIRPLLAVEIPERDLPPPRTREE